MRTEITRNGRGQEVRVNGTAIRRFTRTPKGGYSRSIFIDEGLGVVVKIDDGDIEQGRNEMIIWDELLTPEDRPFFVPILDLGTTEDGRDYVVEPYYNFQKGAKVQLPFEQQVDDLMIKYCEGGDLGMRQWGIVNGQPLIHDYGYVFIGDWERVLPSKKWNPQVSSIQA